MNSTLHSGGAKRGEKNGRQCANKILKSNIRKLKLITLGIVGRASFPFSTLLRLALSYNS